MELSTLIIILIGGVSVYLILKSIRTFIKMKKDEEEQKRRKKRQDLFHLMEIEVLNENKMNFRQKKEIQDPEFLDENDTKKALETYRNWVWVQMTTFNKCLLHYPQYFDKEHRSDFDERYINKYQDFKKYFPETQFPDYW